jgi:hypothetical protein
MHGKDDRAGFCAMFQTNGRLSLPHNTVPSCLGVVLAVAVLSCNTVLNHRLSREIHTILSESGSYELGLPN